MLIFHVLIKKECIQGVKIKHVSHWLRDIIVDKASSSNHITRVTAITRGGHITVTSDIGRGLVFLVTT